MYSIKKAMEEAFRINMLLPPCPVTTEPSLKYPQVDLLGKYSIIDTAFTYRTMLIDAACNEQPDEVRRETKQLLDSAKPQKYEMEQTSSMLHILELAGALPDLTDTKAYQEMKNQLMERPILKEYHKSISAAEHMAGLKDSVISNYLQNHCAEKLGHPFSFNTYNSRKPLLLTEVEKLLPPPDKNHVKLCAHYSDIATLKSIQRKEKSGPAL